MRRNRRAWDINDSGIIVGESWTAKRNAVHAVVWSGGAALDMNDLLGDNPGKWTLLVARTVNSSGQIAGLGTVNKEPHYFLAVPTGARTATSGATSGPAASGPAPR